MKETALGLSGRIARQFLHTEITPLLALTGLLLGLFAVLVTPREEEPQINVTFANVFIAFPGASAREGEELVTVPAERIVSEIEDVEHVYSASQPGMAMLTVRYEVGTPRTDAIVRLYNAFYQHADWLPKGVGVGQPLIKPKGIDDVPVVAVTLWTADPQLGADDLMRVARSIDAEIQRVPGTRNIDIIGGPARVVRVTLDPQRLTGFGLAIDDLRRALAAANASEDIGGIVAGGREVLVQAGTFLTTPEEVADLVVGVRAGAPVFLRDVATVELTADTPESYVRYGSGPAASSRSGGRQPALTLAISKKAGENAVEVAAGVIQRLEQLRGTVIPESVEVRITRDYGATAQDKAQTLIKKLIFATLSVIVLVLFALGRREALVVGAAVIATLALTLFASWAWGFTLNRVSLFALIFSIGILVDDAIVVVENIHRHLQHGRKSLAEAIPAAVDEVGGPTILATFTVIAALLPMAFVTGLMGPYMRPIPINASTGMLISLAVAFMFTPWLYRRLFAGAAHGHGAGEDAMAERLHRFFTRAMTPFLRGAAGNRNRFRLLWVLLALIALSLGLAGMRAVILKMLPFDNKSEFQILVDLPEGTPLEDTQRLLDALADAVAQIPEVTDYQTYAGASAPINFNGLVRQYYLRRASHQGDIQVNLLDRSLRERKSHQIATAARTTLAEIGQRHGASVKVVEVPPGPPVLAPLVAEIYGADDARRQAVAGDVARAFAATPEVVDIDTTLEAEQPKWIIAVDRARAARLGVPQQAAAAAVATALRGEDAGYLHGEHARYPVPVRLRLSPGDQADPAVLKSLRVRAQSGALVPLSEVADIRIGQREPTRHRKDLLPVVYVTGDVAGATDSPLYGMAAIAADLEPLRYDGRPLSQYLTRQPDTDFAAALKWDGEWQVTFETFRDMGIAYSAGLVLIYLLIVAQFRSYGLPLIIMAPIPLTLIGIMPGHALLGQQFTAPSMIGMIALAGIIVRNSILLVDFIQQEVRAGKPLQEATIAAAAVRARPIALTAVAAMLGGFFILDDPIFGGLAVSLIFGLFVSTVLTLLVIPVVYYAYHWREEQAA
jgi:multidrug efflux pump subunit AcrB